MATSFWGPSGESIPSFLHLQELSIPSRLATSQDFLPFNYLLVRICMDYLSHPLMSNYFVSLYLQ